ncbi:MinD/ParA family ATP-binding protein, partial [Ramlibacter alkalitolerans]
MLEHGQDQAAGLRALLAPPPLALLAFPLARAQPPHWVARLAHALCALGRKPVVLDGVRGTLAGCFGLRPRRDLLDLLEGRAGFDAVAQATASGIHVLRAERGVEAFAASGAPAQRLLSAFAGLSHGFDDLLLALPPAELACLAGPPHSVPVIGLAPTAVGLVQAYEAIKGLAEGFGYRRFACVGTGEGGGAGPPRLAAA